jgi:hypothetical protein
MTVDIHGRLSPDKRLILDCAAPVSAGESMAAELHIELPEAEEYRYVLEFESGGKSYFTGGIEPDGDNVLHYGLPAPVLARTGEVNVQLTAMDKADTRKVYKSLLTDESRFYVYTSINADAAIKIIPNAITRAEEAADNCYRAASEVTHYVDLAQEASDQIAGILEDVEDARQQLQEDKDSGAFNGAKGDKGDKGDKGSPSTLDRCALPDGGGIDLSDESVSLFGSAAAPLTVTEAAVISFSGLALAENTQRSFILYLKRAEDVEVTFPAGTVWAYGEPALLPVGCTQKILFEMPEPGGIFATAGDYFHV